MANGDEARGGRGRAPDTQPLNLARIVFELVRSPRGWAVDDLLSALEISERTYRKYRLNLQKLFAPWQQGGESLLVEERDGAGRRVLCLREPRGPNRQVDGLLFRLVSLQLASETLGLLADGDLSEVLPDLADQLAREGRRQFPLAFEHVVRDLDRLLVVIPYGAKRYEEQQATLRAALRCLVFRRVLRLRYDAASGEERDHEVEPLSLLMFRGGLHLLARYPGKEKVYNFVLDRIVEASPGVDYFVYPEREAFDPRALYRDAFGVFLEPEPGEPLEVEVVFAPIKWLKLYVREREWQRGQRVEDLPDGRLRLSFSVRSLVEVVPWVLQFGEDVEVVGPLELEKAVAGARRRSPGADAAG